MLAGIKDILIITNPKEEKNFKKAVGDGSHLGIKIRYLEQKTKGIPEAFKIGKNLFQMIMLLLY